MAAVLAFLYLMNLLSIPSEARLDEARIRKRRDLVLSHDEHYEH